LSIPPEIISHIFLNCLPTAEHPARPSPVAPPLLLAQVCHHWRKIALSTSELWSSVYLLFPSLTRDKEKLRNEKALTLLETCFRRAKGRPLSLKMRSTMARVPEAILSLVSSASARFHTLDLYL
ncbi:hypothetical protein DFH06DRAFT_938908, partial [Mycena polygramma]